MHFVCGLQTRRGVIHRRFDLLHVTYSVRRDWRCKRNATQTDSWFARLGRQRETMSVSQLPVIVEVGGQCLEALAACETDLGSNNVFWKVQSRGRSARRWLSTFQKRGHCCFVCSHVHLYKYNLYVFCVTGNHSCVRNTFGRGSAFSLFNIKTSISSGQIATDLCRQ